LIFHSALLTGFPGRPPPAGWALLNPLNNLNKSATISFQTLYLPYLSALLTLDISKMYFIHWKPPGVSERMWSVYLDASIAGEYESLEGHSSRPTE
jgi:hypothetical protein